MKTIITYGTFDLFHVGHVRLLEKLSKLGDRLIVGVSSDEFNSTKGKMSFFSYEERAEIVRSSKFVDDVFSEDNWEQKINDIKKYDADVFAIGDDWSGEFDFLKSYCEVFYMPRTENVSTTDIKKALGSLKYEKLDELEKSVIDMVEIVKALKF